MTRTNSKAAARQAIRRLAGLVAVAALAAWPAASEPVLTAWQVVFHDYRTLIAEDVSPSGDLVVLRLASGAEIVVPASAVLEIRTYTPPPPEPPPEASDARPVCTPDASSWRAEAGEYAEIVQQAAQDHQLEPELVAAVALAESRFDALALSRKGAQGVMQLMPSTARTMRVGDVWSAKQNIEAGARWLRRLLDRFSGNLDLALAAYNAGEEAVRRYGGIPPYPETVLYVQRVRKTIEQFRCAQRDQPA